MEAWKQSYALVEVNFAPMELFYFHGTAVVIFISMKTSMEVNIIHLYGGKLPFEEGAFGHYS